VHKIVENVECKSLIPRKQILKEKLLSSSIKLFIVICLLLITTYAWFINNKNVGVSDLSATTAPVNTMEISLDNGLTWSKIAELNIVDNFILYKESTSDGITFYKPNAKGEDGTPLNFIPAVKNEDYLEYKVLFKSATESTVYLEKKSEVYPAAGKNIINLINSSEVIRESTDGNFSRDLIAGAVRIAFIENDLVNGTFVEQNTPKFVWAPNKGYQVKYENNKCIGYLDSTDQQQYKYTKVLDYDSYYLEDLSNVIEDIDASYETHTSGGDTPLTNIENNSQNSNENIRAITIRIWVEGNDREAIYSLKGGQFKINISFLGLSK
jgi:hypothetical protein